MLLNHKQDGDDGIDEILVVKYSFRQIGKSGSSIRRLSGFKAVVEHLDINFGDVVVFRKVLNDEDEYNFAHIKSNIYIQRLMKRLKMKTMTVLFYLESKNIISLKKMMV